MTRVFIVAASPAVRQSLGRLAASPEVRVSGEGDSLAALDGAAEHPDVVVLADERCLADPPDPRDDRDLAIVVLARENAARLAARLGGMDLHGWAVVPAHAGPGQLQAGILAAAAGLAALPAASPVDRFVRAGTGDDDGDPESVEMLTPREHEVLEWLARGLSNRAIGEQLGISEHTAKFHVASVLAKLGAGNRAEAVGLGLRRGLVAL